MREKQRVLIADMDDAFRWDLSRELTACGLDVTVLTNSGEAVVEACQKVSIDLVIMNLLLAESDGVAVLKELSRLPGKPLIVVASAFSRSGIGTVAASCGADYFLTKPCSVKLAAERVISLLDAPRLPRREPDEQISQLLVQMQIPRHHKGYLFLQAALELTVADPTLLEGVTKVLYPAVAKQFTSTASRVEKNIRSVIERAWDTCDPKVLYRYFGSTTSIQRGRPTNREFLVTVTDLVRVQEGKRFLN